MTKTAPRCAFVIHTGNGTSPIANDVETLDRLACYPMRSLTPSALFAVAMRLESPYANTARTMARSSYREVLS